MNKWSSEFYKYLCSFRKMKNSKRLLVEINLITFQDTCRQLLCAKFFWWFIDKKCNCNWNWRCNPKKWWTSKLYMTLSGKGIKVEKRNFIPALLYLSCTHFQIAQSSSNVDDREVCTNNDVSLEKGLHLKKTANLISRSHNRYRNFRLYISKLFKTID